MEMAKKKAKKSSTQDSSRRLVEDSDVPAIMKDVRLSSDRTAAIVLAAWLEQALEQAILAKLVRKDADMIRKMQDVGGSLSGFFAKNYLGYALDLYDKNTLFNLESIRKIRNASRTRRLEFHLKRLR